LKTVVGDLKFGKDGEWTEPRVLQIQFQDVKGNGIDQFKNPATQVILSPKAYVSGKIIYPYAGANK